MGKRSDNRPADPWPNDYKGPKHDKPDPLPKRKGDGSGGKPPKNPKGAKRL